MKTIFFLLLLLPFIPMNLDGHERQREEESAPVAIPEDKEPLREIGASYLREIKPIFKRACFDCHSNHTRYPWYHQIPGVRWWIDGDIREAREHIDMTHDLPFKGHGNIKKDLKAIQEAIEEGDMPPWDYRLMHPEARLTNGEKDAILKWIQEGQKLLTP